MDTGDKVTTETRNLNINCQTAQRLERVKGSLSTIATLLKFSSLHEFIRWIGEQPPEKVANALRELRIDELRDKA